MYKLSLHSNTVKTSVLIALCLVLSCDEKTFNTEKELLTYIQDESNGYIQHKTVNGVDFTLLYRPTDLLIKQEIGSDEITKEKIEELRKKYNKYMYFNLSMSKNNKELLSVAPKNRNEFGQMVNQLAFGMGDKVHVYTQSKDTLEMTDFVYPRMYGMSKSTSIMFVYPRDNEKLKASTEHNRSDEYLNFAIEDLGLYTGEVKFKIKNKDINNEPTISFKKNDILSR